MKYVLNLPWTLIGCLTALVSIPKDSRIEKDVLIFNVQSWWWTRPFTYLKGVRGMTIGNVVLLGPNAQLRDLEHELVHVEQFMRYPFVFAFMNAYEIAKRGYRDNRFEAEAYGRAGNRRGGDDTQS